VYLELDPKLIRLFVKHKCRVMKICNFSPDWYFIFDNCKAKFRDCFCVKVGCLLMILSRNECQSQ